MNEQEAIIFIKNAMEQSRNALAELMLSAPKVFKRRTELLGEYYSNLENCKKEIQSCEVAIKALEEIQQYRAIGTVNEFKSLKENWLNKFDSLIEYRKIGTPEECRAAVEKQDKMPMRKGYDNGRIRKCCGRCGCFVLPASKYCSKCGQKLDWSEEE